jgi:hypothetical protein
MQSLTQLSLQIEIQRFAQLGETLTAQNFDDGRCYQINSDNISVARQKEFSDPTPGQPESINEQWCETDVVASPMQGNCWIEGTNYGQGSTLRSPSELETAHW